MKRKKRRNSGPAHKLTLEFLKAFRDYYFQLKDEAFQEFYLDQRTEVRLNVPSADPLPFPGGSNWTISLSAPGRRDPEKSG